MLLLTPLRRLNGILPDMAPEVRSGALAVVAGQAEVVSTRPAPSVRRAAGRKTAVRPATRSATHSKAAGRAAVTPAASVDAGSMAGRTGRGVPVSRTPVSGQVVPLGAGGAPISRDTTTAAEPSSQGAAGGPTHMGHQRQARSAGEGDSGCQGQRWESPADRTAQVSLSKGHSCRCQPLWKEVEELVRSLALGAYIKQIGLVTWLKVSKNDRAWELNSDEMIWRDIQHTIWVLVFCLAAIGLF
ncbi:Hypothetical predicted protein [Pelobates cultripes]|uniref:Uncharacterized protein n=1 Tax=Pelobates cultripes TaxID=61616 RepID=A0AAD1VMH8_PELCU|nr:Hypothetical predicted protein [Pelobates cultripes]